jgi:hypothetical protein
MAHIAAVRDGTNIILYVNEVQVASVSDNTWGNDISSGAQGLKIGASPVGANLLDFAGIIDDIHIYNRALPPTEIQENYQKNPDFSSNLIAKVSKGTTQVIVTLEWIGQGSITTTITSPSQSYTEDLVSVYQKTTYLTTIDNSNILNIKRLSISVEALSADQNWAISLAFNNANAYQISVETQK